jgi:hypothetical protein
MTRCLGPALAAGLLVTAGPAVAAAFAELASHRAAYRLSLDARDEATDIDSVRGGLVLEWRGGCDGSITHQRLSFVAAMPDGPGFTYDVRFSSFESTDATRFRFSTRAYDDGAIAEETRGEASLAGLGGAGEARFTLPPDTALALPQGTVFPTEHLRQVLGAARDGQRFLVHDVFDGSGEDGLSRVTAVIGAPREVEGLRRWPVNLAYYPIGGADPTPEFELAFELGATGILHGVRLDFGDFSLAGVLEKLEMLPAERCE